MLKRQCTPLSTVVSVALLAMLLAACPSRQLRDGTREERLSDLLAIGAAQAEIEDWQQARDNFLAAVELVPGERAAEFDLALAELRLGNLEAAGRILEAVAARGGTPEILPALAARFELLRATLAVEKGDFDAQAAALLRAAELDPNEPSYPYALAQAAYRLEGAAANAERGRWLLRAHELWPENSRLVAELAQWRLDQPELEMRQSGAALLEGLAAGSDLAQVQALVDRGLEEMSRPLQPQAESERAPVALRQALNLLRPGKRFQIDSASLEARLQPRPFTAPLEEAPTFPQERNSLTLTVGSQLPAFPLDDGEAIQQVVAFNDASGDFLTRDRDADLAVLTDRGLYWLARRESQAARIDALLDGVQLTAGDLDADGLMELIAIGGRGVAVYGRREQSAAWTRQALDPALTERPLRSGLLIDFEQDGDLDLLAVGKEGELLLITHRGESGWGAPALAPLPGPFVSGPLAERAPALLLASSDLDGDHDQDLLVLSASELRILLNERQGQYRALEDRGGEVRALPASPRSVATLDADGDGAFDLAVASSAGVDLWRNIGYGQLERDAAATAGVRAALATGASGLAAVDLDLDGDLDLVVTSKETRESGDVATVVVLQNLGGRFVAEPGVSLGASAAPADRVAGVIALDLDGDHYPDLVTNHGEKASPLATLRVSSDSGSRWIALGLRGLAGKVPLDGLGSRIAVIGQGVESVYEPKQPEVTLGLGDRSPALVRVTWPNGISEYLFKPTPKRRHVVQQVLRIEGSCPFLYASDGASMRFVTDILGTSPLGMLVGPGIYASADPEEYLRLPDWVAWQDGKVELRISEELREVAYLDQVELVVVDTPTAIVAYNGERWIEPAVEGLDLRLLASLSPPVAVHDDQGRDVLEIVARDDQRYLTNHRTGRRYQGAVAPHRLTIELPAELAATAHPALLLDGWLHWANTSVNVARAQDPRGAPMFPVLEVGDGAGEWREVPGAVGLPAGKRKPIVVDLTGFVDARHRHLRLTTDFEVYWDRIAVARGLPQEEVTHRVHRLAPQSASLSYQGFSRWYREAPNGPYVFDPADRRPYPWRPAGNGGERVLAWQEHAGWYTSFGDVTSLVTAVDDRLAVFGSGEELALVFDSGALAPLADGWRRTLFLHSEGWEKDGDPNVSCGQTVEPMPYRGMQSYPCASAAGTSVEAAPQDRSRNRWVPADRLTRRVELLIANSEP